ncbi:MAG TPA: hypothetical protein VD837_07725 [Terriglobales bacterium]|nr:hypothetical protein [Terriglobales bacterium]
MSLGTQVVWLFIMAIPIACVAWTVTHEEVFRELREYCERRSENARSIWERKFFYLFTCEYCFSHYVTAFFLFLTEYKLLYQDWRGYLLAFFAFPFLSNLYMGLYAQTKLGVKKERTQIKAIQEDVEIKKVEKEALANGHGRKLHRPAA